MQLNLQYLQVPDGEDVIRRTADLLKPGGWLLVEEPDYGSTLDDGGPAGSGITEFLQTWLGMLRSRGADPCIGARLSAILQITGVFEEVNVEKLIIPYHDRTGGGNSAVSLPYTHLICLDPHLDELGKVWLNNAIQVVEDLSRRFPDDGLTRDVADKCIEDLRDPKNKLTTDMYFTWSRKRCT